MMRNDITKSYDINDDFFHQEKIQDFEFENLSLRKIH